MSVWSELVGQQRAVAVLSRAVEAASSGATAGRQAMSHAWLITGPPGSGRSNAGRAFAAALQCRQGGCGQCSDCRIVLSGAHPDVTLVRTEKLSLGIDEVHDLVRRAAMSPTLGRYQVLVIEDADRLTERGADALLKSVEEPPVTTVWILCAPTPEDVVITIRSRCRALSLVTPSDEAVAQLLHDRDGVDTALASHAARAAQGHIGRARALARDEQARIRRNEVLHLPAKLTSISACLVAADNVVKAAAEEAAALTDALDVTERSTLGEALGLGGAKSAARHAQAALKELEDEQKLRAKRAQRDALDRVLTELTAYYRDVLGVQLGALTADPDPASTGGLINAELRHQIADQARSSSAEQTVRRLDAIVACRTALEGNVAPLLAMEAMMVALAAPR